MQFTPQQLAGAGRYTAHTLIGNWNEDVQLEETKYKDYAARKDHGEVAAQGMQQKLEITSQRVPHAFSADGNVRFGDTITVEHSQTGGTLANDIWEETSLASGEHVVTVCKLGGAAATARNTFVITRAPNDDGDDPVLSYGQAFRLRCNPTLLVDATTGLLNVPSFLSSRMKSDASGSKISNNQQVFMSTRGGSDSLWTVTAPCIGRDGGMERFMAEGEPVQANELACLQHVMTNQPLSADARHLDTTDFGDEYEACCAVRQVLGKTHQLVDELRGTATAETAAKNELSQNHWRICTAADEAAAEDSRNLPGELTAGGIASFMSDFLGEAGVSHLEAALAAVGAGGSVDREDVKWSLREEYRVPLTDAHIDVLLDALDDGQGMVDVADLIGRL